MNRQQLVKFATWQREQLGHRSADRGRQVGDVASIQVLNHGRMLPIAWPAAADAGDGPSCSPTDFSSYE